MSSNRAEIPDPLTLLRAHHSAALDRKDELSIEARSLTARIQEVAAELPLVTARADLYGALVASLEKRLK